MEVGQAVHIPKGGRTTPLDLSPALLPVISYEDKYRYTQNPIWKITMENLFRFVLPIGAFLATLLSWVVLIIVNRLIRSRKAQSPAPASPIAATHQPLIDAAMLQAQTALGAAVATPVVLSAAYVAALYSQSVVMDWQAVLLLIVGGLALWTYAIFRWRSALGRQRKLQWHYAAREMVEWAVADLERRGHIVIRNVEVNELKLDYLLIGDKGVFTLQTVVHPIPSQSDQISDITVTYDGRTLFFPNEKDNLSIESAQTGAEHFSEWLSDQLDTPVAARAILALPGWQVKRISAEGISVIHPGQMEALFQYVKARPLSAEVIQQIKQLIERHQASPSNTNDQNDIKETTGSYS